MIQLFKDLTTEKERIDHIMTIFNINENNPIPMNPDSECLNFELISKAQRCCSEEVTQRIKELPSSFEEIRKKIFYLFVKQSKIANKKYFRNNRIELLNEIFGCLNTNDLWNYVDTLSKTISSKAEYKVIGNLYLIYVLEFVIGIYEIMFKEQKVIENGFHEVNEMFTIGNGKEFITISIDDADSKKSVEMCSVFTCCLTKEIEKFKKSVDINKFFENKNRLRGFHEMIIHSYMMCFSTLKTNL